MESIKYIGPENINSLELQPYVVEPEFIPNKVGIASHGVQPASIEELFELDNERSFAHFSPPPLFTLKNLFKEKAIPNLDIKGAIAQFDDMDGDERAKQLYIIFAMFYQIMELNELVEEIRLKLISLLKT